MSKTTTNLPVIKSISNIDAHTVEKLYAQHDIEQPMYVEREPRCVHPALVHTDDVIT